MYVPGNCATIRKFINRYDKERNGTLRLLGISKKPVYI
jgi:hypothetical protein